MALRPFHLGRRC